MRRLHAALAGALGLLALAAGLAPVQAHPHLLIAQTVRLIVADGQFTAIELEWSFDPFNSDLEIAAIDDDKDGKLSAREEKELAKIALGELKRFGYLTWFNTGGKDERPARAPTFSARIDSPARFMPGGWGPMPDEVAKSPAAGAILGKELLRPQPGMKNLVYVLRFALPKPGKRLAVMAIDAEDYIRIELLPGAPFAVVGDNGRASCTVDKHPTIKAEYVRGYPFYADRVSCTLP